MKKLGMILGLALAITATTGHAEKDDAPTSGWQIARSDNVRGITTYYKREDGTCCPICQKRILRCGAEKPPAS
jgi:hypothetical protein